MKMKLREDPTKARSLSTIIEDYRSHIRDKRAVMSIPSKRGGFAATLQGEQQHQNKHVPKCVCGAYHWWNKCFYLNKDKRPTNWTPNKEVQQRIQKAMSNKDLKKKIEDSIAKSKSLEHSKQPSQEQTAKKIKEDTNNEDSASVASFPTTIQATSLSTTSADCASTLELSWIADTGSTHHVCNRHMKHRYTKTRNASSDDTITSGNITTPIKSFGEVSIKAQTLTGTRTIILRDVAYVPSFMANLLSVTKCMDKDVHLDTGRGVLYNLNNNNTVCKVTRYQNQLFVELNKALDNPKSIISSCIASRNLPADQWHEIFAHAGEKVIKSLPQAVTGAIITHETTLSSHCDVCARTKAHEQVSRDTQPEESSNQPFFRVTFDLIHMAEAYNHNQWITHLECHQTKWRFSEPHTSKSETGTIAISLIEQISARFKRRVAFFRSDNETALGNDFKQQLRQRGITWETSSPFTPAQNGSSERSGGIIISKARALRVSANLPEGLWPETVKAAVYISNRTPTKSLNYTTPFEAVHGVKPSVQHLRVYGCKAYVLNKQIPHKNKMQERALIGYLIGYDSRNIFRIWQPPLQKVIRSRDVTFDETSKYQPNDPEQIQEPHEAEEERELIVPRITLSNSDTEDLIESEDQEESPSLPQQSQDQCREASEQTTQEQQGI